MSLDPDPLTTPEDELAATWYSHGWDDRGKQPHPASFAVGLVIGIVLAAILVVIVAGRVNAASRSSAQPVIPASASTRTRGLEGIAPSGNPAGTTIGTPHSSPAASLPTTPSAAHTVRGQGSWYCGHGSRCTSGYPGGLYAAAGPALRVGDWRGRQVSVRYGGSVVVVTLIDFCACPQRTLDLYRDAFSRLADPSVGLIPVTVTWGNGPELTAPPTDSK